MPRVPSASTICPSAPRARAARRRRGAAQRSRDQRGRRRRPTRRPGSRRDERTGAQIEGRNCTSCWAVPVRRCAVLVIRAAQDIRTAAASRARPYLIQLLTGRSSCSNTRAGKGKGVLDSARRAKALEISCAKLTRPDERADFVRAEIRRAVSHQS